MMNETRAANYVHWPAMDETGCARCHRPHASKVASLLTEPPKTLCAQCHPGAIRQQAESSTPHPPVAEGECSACHSPHASNAALLLLEDDEVELCGTCHDWQAHSSHPIGPDVLDPRNANLSMDCSSCHSAHGSSFEKFLNDDPKGPLCVSCHEQFRR
jgi:predicted CXXCH cytochrome family protein